MVTVGPVVARSVYDELVVNSVVTTSFADE
jgi:hypothetical protein